MHIEPYFPCNPLMMEDFAAMELANRRVVARDGVMFREIAGEAVLLSLDSETYFGLDDVGTRMWTVLVASPSIAEALSALTDEFEVDGGTLRADLEGFITRLAGAGLVAVEDA